MAFNPGGPAWYHTALGVPAFAVGDDARAAEALASNPSDVPDRLLYLAAAEAMLGHVDRARRAGDRLRELVPGFDLAFYMDAWPWEPGLWQRLHEGAVGLGSARSWSATDPDPPPRLRRRAQLSGARPPPRTPGRAGRLSAALGGQDNVSSGMPVDVVSARGRGDGVEAQLIAYWT